MANLSEQEKMMFVRSYEAYQKSCDQVQEARQNLHRTTTEVKARLAKVPIAPAQGVEHWDPEEAENASDALKDWGEAHIIMGESLVSQSKALRDTTDTATGLIEKAVKAANG